MREVGVIKKSEGGYAEVSVLKRSACGENCASCKGGCVPGERIIRVKNPIDAVPGDKVIMETDERLVLLAAFLAYILPIIIFFLGYFLFGFLFKKEGLKILSALLAMAASYLVIRAISGKNEKYMAKIVKKL